MNSNTLIMLPGTGKTCKDPYLLVKAVTFKSDDVRRTLGLSHQGRVEQARRVGLCKRVRAMPPLRPLICPTPDDGRRKNLGDLDGQNQQRPPRRHQHALYSARHRRWHASLLGRADFRSPPGRSFRSRVPAVP
jgi:hypothetical protein